MIGGIKMKEDIKGIEKLLKKNNDIYIFANPHGYAIKGTYIDILSCMCALIRYIREQGIEEAEIRRALELAMLDEKTLKEKVLKIIDEADEDELLELFESFLGHIN